MARRSIDGKRVVVTGASSGIGHQLALQLAGRHCRVVINARRSEKLESLSREIEQRGGQAESVVGDITEPGVRQAILDAARSRFDGLDVLINNAGIGALGPFTDANEQRLRRVMEVNFFAPAELTRLAIPLLERGDNPVVANISSVLGHRGVPLKSEYCASKFAIHGWADSIRGELVDRKIDVLLVSPSTTASEFFDSVIDRQEGKYKTMSRAQSPAYVAQRTIKAIERGDHEIILSWSGWAMVWLDRLMPTFANRLVAKYGKS